MQQDQRGYTVATDNPDAVAALDDAIMSYVRFRTDIMPNLDRAITADPEFGLPHVIRGLLLESLKQPRLIPKAQQELDAARAARPPQTDRERRYLAALEVALQGKVTAAATCYQQIAAEHPHDLFAIRHAQSELFWIGEVGWMRDISERAAPAWSSDQWGYSVFQSIRSFGLEETGNRELAERCGREAVELDPADCWGAHAVAHVLIMQGRLAEGVEWLDNLDPNWGAANHIKHHLWWHLALFHAERGDYDAALAVYDDRLRDLDSPLMQAMPDFYVDIQNDVSILQRLEIRGIDVGDRWQPIADLAEARIGNHASPFTSAHCALALAAAGRYDEARVLIREAREFTAAENGALGARYTIAVIPASEAAVAYRQGDFAQVIELLLPARRNLWQMGGSHAQRDLFYQLIMDSAVRENRREVIDLMAAELVTTGLDHLDERSSYADAMRLLD